MRHHLLKWAALAALLVAGSGVGCCHKSRCRDSGASNRPTECVDPCQPGR